MQAIISVENLNKVYAGGFQALKNINLEINKGEIFALLGPNGAGKTSLISIICGIANASSGTVKVGGYDIARDFRETRALIGLVPQELTTDAFETVWDTVNFSRSLFGKASNPEFVEKLLKDLTLWDKKDSRIMSLSGGMKRRVMIAKALSHEPSILFLDEPTAGVDVELRKDMWEQVRELTESGVTIILTTHYIEEAEDMADRIGIINQGELGIVEEKYMLMKKLGKKHIAIELENPIEAIPEALKHFDLCLDGTQLKYTFDPKLEKNGVSTLLALLAENNISYHDLNTKQSTLEEIFIELVK